jgi:hypothetical protein
MPVAIRIQPWNHFMVKTVQADEQFWARLREVQARRKRRPPHAKAGLEKVFDLLPDDEISREAARLGEEWRKSEGAREITRGE